MLVNYFGLYRYTYIKVSYILVHDVAKLDIFSLMFNVTAKLYGSSLNDASCRFHTISNWHSMEIMLKEMAF